MKFLYPRIATTTDWLFAPDLLTIEQACFLSGWDRDTMCFIVNDGGVDLDDAGLIFKDSLEEYQEALLLALNLAPSSRRCRWHSASCRVEAVVAHRPPHRPGREQFAHPVRQ